MPLIGSRTHALRAYEVVQGLIEDNNFEHIGSGSMRDCLMHKETGVVYKVQTWECEDYTNDVELRNARTLRRRKFKHVRIPKTSGFTVNGALIIAMEMITGTLGTHADPKAAKAARKELFERCRFADMHGENFIIDENEMIVPVDMGSPIHRSTIYADRRVLTCGNGNLWGDG